MYKQSDSLDIWSSEHIVSGCADACNGCSICKKECAFLERYGNPGKIARMYESEPDKCLTIAFECSLCGLCTSICPKQLDPPAMFLDLRRKALKKEKLDLSIYKRLLNYEKKGTSNRYSYYHFPENCNAVFFPGCSLSGTRSETTLKVYQYLQSHDDSIGIVLDCCTKPSHDLGRQEYFDTMFSQMKLILLENHIRTIIVACPSCHNIFNTYAKEFNLETVYEVMAESGLEKSQNISGQVTIHDPCPVRFQDKIHSSVRSIASAHGLEIKDTPHQKAKTYCCGEGGSVSCQAPELASIWSQKRADENSEYLMASYCSGCVSYLSKKKPVFHILDLVFDSKRTLAGKAKVSQAPFTYFNRLKLKGKLKRLPAKMKRERGG